MIDINGPYYFLFIIFTQNQVDKDGSYYWLDPLAQPEPFQYQPWMGNQGQVNKTLLQSDMDPDRLGTGQTASLKSFGQVPGDRLQTWEL